MNILVKYYGATWCAPCKQAKPEVQRICRNYTIPLQELNFDDLDSSESEAITKLPTVQIWQNEKLIQEYTKNQVTQLEDWMNTHVRVIPSDDF